SLPADFYEKYGLTNEANVADALDKRSNNNTKGLGANPLIWESVITKWEMEEGKVKDIYLHPIELGFELPRYQRGWPKLSDKMEIIEELQRLSKPYGTKIEMEDGIGRIRLTP